MMTRKHFEAIAAAVKEVRDVPRIHYTRLEKEILDRMSGKLADVCAGSNGNFDKGRFLRACGV
jgi:hypothetical protein